MNNAAAKKGKKFSRDFYSNWLRCCVNRQRVSELFNKLSWTFDKKKLKSFLFGPKGDRDCEIRCMKVTRHCLLRRSKEWEKM